MLTGSREKYSTCRQSVRSPCVGGWMEGIAVCLQGFRMVPAEPGGCGRARGRRGRARGWDRSGGYNPIKYMRPQAPPPSPATAGAGRGDHWSSYAIARSASHRCRPHSWPFTPQIFFVVVATSACWQFGFGSYSKLTGWNRTASNQLFVVSFVITAPPNANIVPVHVQVLCIISLPVLAHTTRTSW